MVEFPKQTLLCANHITWTAKVQDGILQQQEGGDEAAGKDKSSLSALKSDNAAFMLELSGLVLRESDAEAARTLANLILSQGYFGDVVQKLIDDDVDSAEDFVWLSRLRYYCTMGSGTTSDKKKGDDDLEEEDEASRAAAAARLSSVELRMMHSVVPYGYEYLSPHCKLVMTPLTERCYQILLIALDLYQVFLNLGRLCGSQSHVFLILFSREE